MTRKELANEVYNLLKSVYMPKRSECLWKAIAETDDWSLIDEYTRLKERAENAKSTM